MGWDGWMDENGLDEWIGMDQCNTDSYLSLDKSEEEEEMTNEKKQRKEKRSAGDGAFVLLAMEALADSASHYPLCTFAPLHKYSIHLYLLMISISICLSSIPNYILLLYILPDISSCV